MNGDHCKGQKWDTGKNKLVSVENKAKSYKSGKKKNEDIREKAYAKNDS